MGEENERKRCADHVREKGKTKFGEWVGEWILFIKICE